MVKLYDCTPAPSPRRVRILLAEKGLQPELLPIDLAGKEQLSAEYRAINPQCTVPALQLEDGTVITEYMGIAAWAEAEKPEPAMLGRDAREKGLVAMWVARIDQEGFLAAAEAFRNSTPGMRDRAVTGPENYAQIAELAERGKTRLLRFFQLLDEQLQDQQFIITDQISAADVSATVMVDFAAWMKIRPTAEQKNLQRWHAMMALRPSATA